MSPRLPRHPASPNQPPIPREGSGDRSSLGVAFFMNPGGSASPGIPPESPEERVNPFTPVRPQVRMTTNPPDRPQTPPPVALRPRLPSQRRTPKGLSKSRNSVNSDSISRGLLWPLLQHWITGSQRRVSRKPTVSRSPKPPVAPQPFPMKSPTLSTRSQRRRSVKRSLQVVPDPPNGSLGAVFGREARGGRNPDRPRRSRKLPAPVLYAIRLLILGVGLGVVAGTLLAAIDPSYQQLADQADQTQPLNDNAVTKAKGRGQLTANPVPNFTQGQHLTDLEAKMRAITQEQPDLIPGVFVADLDTGAYAEINGSQKFATASMIKVPVLVAFFQEVDAGTIQLGEMLTMRADLVAPHAGDMQYLPVPTPRHSSGRCGHRSWFRR